MEPPTPADIIKNSLSSPNANNIHDNNTNDITMVTSGKNDDNSISPSSSNDSKNELRHRHQEKKDRLTAQVREMKRRQKQTEDWQKLKRSLFKPVTIGIGTVIIGGGVVAICSYLYSRG